MKHFTYSEKGITYERVTKKAARTAYEKGTTVLLCPVNLRPSLTLNCMTSVRKDLHHDSKTGAPMSFDRLVAYYELQSILNKGNGYYTAFYVPTANVANEKEI